MTEHFMYWKTISVGYNDEDFNDNETYFLPKEVNYTKPSGTITTARTQNSYQQHMEAMQQQQQQQ